MKKTVILLIFLMLLVSSCYDNPADNPVGNKAPETSVFLIPDSTISSQPSRLRIHWTGDDPDGFVIGYYFTWDGVNWTFTQGNDSLFALQIGAADTNYVFKVAAVDDAGNGLFDNEVLREGVSYGSEPFIDKNLNGKYDSGEKFIDIGLIDSEPAVLNIPIKNSAPLVKWNQLSFLPDTSFPVMTFSWTASDIDGDETIQNINIALNDTSAFVSLKGSARTITIRARDYDNPLMEILLDGNPNTILPEKLSGLKLNDNNVFYVQAVDISGARSPFIELPAQNKKWFVKRPSGNFLVIDDYGYIDNAPEFYYRMMDSLGLTGKYDVFDLRKNAPPFINVTFLETIKLFKYIFWYTDSYPSVDLASASTQKYLDNGGKVFFSIQFPQTLDLNIIQEFLPIIPDSADIKISIYPGQKLLPVNQIQGYPVLETSTGIFWVCSFYLGSIGVIPIYYLSDNPVSSYIGFSNSNLSLFMIGLPLHRLNGGSANVKQLMYKVLIEDFGI